MKDFFKNKEYDKYYRDIIPYFKEEKNQRYLMLILTFGASIFFLLFAISPTLSTIAKLNKQISDSKFVEKKLTQKISSLSSLSQSYNNISQDLPVVNDAVPLSPDAPKLAALIQSVAKNSSTELSSVTVSQIDLSSKASTISSAFTFSVTAQGSYDSVNSFLSNLANMQRVITIDTLQITNQADQENLQAIINGTAFYKP